MKPRVAFILLVCVLSASAFVGVAAAQQGDDETCSADSPDYRECLRNATSNDLVLEIINRDPSRLSDRAIDRVNAVYMARSDEFSANEGTMVRQWLAWAEGGDKPDWYGSSSAPTSSDPSTVRSEEGGARKPAIVEIDPSTKVVYNRCYDDNNTCVVGVYSKLTRTLTATDGNGWPEDGQGGHIATSEHTVQRGQTTFFKVTATSDGGDQRYTLAYGSTLVGVNDDDARGTPLVPGPYDSGEAQLLLALGAIVGILTLVIIIRRMRKKALKKGVIRR